MFGRVSKSMFGCAEDSFPQVTTERTIERSCHVSPVCIDQHFILVWLDENMNAMGSIDCCKMVVHLQGIANAMCTFNNADQCIDFLTNVVDQKVVLVVSDTYGQAIVPLVHEMPQISSIYVFYENSFKYEQWVKVKNVFTHISSSCDAFKRNVPSCNSCSASISVSLTTNRIYYQNMDYINQSFIYYYKLLQILCHLSLLADYIFLTVSSAQFIINIRWRSLFSLQQVSSAKCLIYIRMAYILNNIEIVKSHVLLSSINIKIYPQPSPIHWSKHKVDSCRLTNFY